MPLCECILCDCVSAPSPTLGYYVRLDIEWAVNVLYDFILRKELL